MKKLVHRCGDTELVLCCNFDDRRTLNYIFCVNNSKRRFNYVM